MKKIDSFAILAISFFPSFVLSLYVLPRFNLVGIPLFILTLVLSLWLSTIVSATLTLYIHGKVSWLNDYAWIDTSLLLASVVILLMLFLHIGSFMAGKLIGKKQLQNYKYNFLKSLFIGFVISSISSVPVFILTTLIVLYYSR